MIKEKIRSRYMDLVGSLTGRRSLGAFLKRVGWDGTVRLTPRQTATADGGYSTCPDAVKRGMADVYDEWWRVRRAVPPAAPPAWLAAELAAARPHHASYAAVLAAITRSEFDAALAAFPDDSSPGPSGLPAVTLKALPPLYQDILFGITALAHRGGVLPAAYYQALICAIPKPGGGPDISSSRPICLLEVSVKLYTRILTSRWSAVLEKAGYLGDVQFGFRPGRSATDAFHTVLGAFEDAKERASPLHALFLDVEKAFDSPEPWGLQQAYRLAGAPPRVCKLLGLLDGTVVARALSPFGPTRAVWMRRGVPQGEVLSPTKFAAWLAPLLRRLTSAAHAGDGFVMRGGTELRVVAYADDLVLLSSSAEGLQRMADTVGEFFAYHGVSLKESKCEYLSPDGRGVVHVQRFSRASSPGAPVQAEVAIAAQGPTAVVKYLGGRLSLGLNWSALTKAARGAVDADLTRLEQKALTFEEVLAYAETVIQGRWNYVLQISQDPDATLRRWDVRLDRLLRRVGRFSHGATLSAVHAGRSALGLGVFTVAGLQLEAVGTELVVRLNSPGICGAVARERWAALLSLRAGGGRWRARLFTDPDACTRRERGSNFAAYALRRLLRRGLAVGERADGARLVERATRDAWVADEVDSVALPRLYTTGVRWLRTLMYDGVLRPWALLRVRLRRRGAPPPWYVALASIPALVLRGWLERGGSVDPDPFTVRWREAPALLTRLDVFTDGSVIDHGGACPLRRARERAMVGLAAAAGQEHAGREVAAHYVGTAGEVL
jgi:hypothetical protein